MLFLGAGLLVSLAAATAQAPAGSDTFEARRAQLFEQAKDFRPGGAYREALRMGAGLPMKTDVIANQLERVAERHDCSDFTIHAFLRLLFQFGESPLMDPAIKEGMTRTVLGFKYWPDEPGIDSMCYWSENHLLLYSSAGYLAGQRFPNEKFTNSGQTGLEKMEANRPRVLRWLDMRFRSGFSEWLSNVYYEEDLFGLMNLVDFCEDKEIQTRATMVVDLMLADIALNSFRGTFGSTHGRSYEGNKKSGAHDSTGDTAWLLFGQGIPGSGSAAASFALSPAYRVPRVLQAMANDTERPVLLDRQRMGIRVKDAKKWGLGFDKLEDGMVWFSLEAYNHPKVIPLTLKMFDAYHWWENKFFAPYSKHKTLLDVCRFTGLMPTLTRVCEKDLTRNLREEVDIYTYRTPDYQLSTAQDWRAGFGGDQQHIWQATLGQDAVCFTTHPVNRRRKESKETPDYWTGSGTLPRAAQDGNAAIVLYNVTTAPGLYVTNALDFTHAWLPKDRFDEYVERAGWHFARKGDGYLALWSKRPTHWQQAEGEDKDRELIAPGKKNIWICELGRKADDGSFESFVERLANARVETHGLRVAYDSPSRGRLEWGWKGPLRRNGQPVALHGFPRYDTPYGYSGFPSETVSFQKDGLWLALDWRGVERRVGDSPNEKELAHLDVRMNEVQVVGSHNSYHAAPDAETLNKARSVTWQADTWTFTRAPFDVQLERGVRCLELDLHPEKNGFEVYHSRFYDRNSTCRSLPDGLKIVDAWSRAHPDHLPITVLFEVKETEIPKDSGVTINAALLQRLDALVLDAIPRQRLITPDDVRGKAKTLEDAVRTTGWPRLSEVRGKIMIVLYAGKITGRTYTARTPALEGWPMFVMSEPGQPDAAMLLRDRPDAEEFRSLIRQGYMIRTRADDSLKPDPARRDTAFSSGAQLIATDFPAGEADPATGYFVECPGGAAGIVNPVLTSHP